MLYKKQCLYCGDDLWGRKNRLYHPDCKTISNNETAGIKRKAISPLVVEFKKQIVPLPDSLKFGDEIGLRSAAEGIATPTASLTHSSTMEEIVNKTIGTEEIPSQNPKFGKWLPIILGGLFITGVVIYFVQKAKKEKEGKKQAALSN